MPSANKLVKALGSSAPTVLRFARGAVGMAAALLASSAGADGWSGSIAFASDNVLRGISQSNGRAALLLDINHRTDTGWAAAAGLAGPGYRVQGDAVELTLALSKAWQLDPDWTIQLGLAHYGYLAGALRGVYDHDDFSASADWQGRLLASVVLSPDTSGRSPQGAWRTAREVAWELTLHERLAGRLALDAGVGYCDRQAISGAGYAYGSVGLNWGLGPMQAYLSWIDSRAGTRGLVPESLAGPRWVTTLLWNF